MNTYMKLAEKKSVTPQFLLRVGGLPITVMDELRFEQSAQWVDAVLLLESLLAARRDGLVAVLHEAVNTHKEDKALRRTLINFKRNIFNMHLADNLADTSLIEAALPAEARGLLTEWLHLWHRYQEALVPGPAIMAQELPQKRGLLKEIINTSDFRKGILLSSPVLDQVIDSYIDSDNLRLAREARTVEHSLLEYLFRTVCKTSPFSTFTSVSFGEFAHEQEISDQAIDLQVSDMGKRSFTRLNMLILSRLSTQLFAIPEIKQVIPVRLTTGWRLQDGKVKYMRRKSGAEKSDEENAAALDIIEENIIQLPVGSLLSRLLDLLGDGHEEKLAGVIAHLCSDDSFRGAEKDVESYLQHLLRLGFLIMPILQLDSHHARPLTEYRKSLQSVASPLLHTLADNLGEIEALVDDYAVASLASRRELLAAIKHKVKYCCAGLGQSEALTHLPKTLLYEDTALRLQKLAINSANWQELLSHASELQQLLPVFDIKLPDKFTLRGYFQGRYGAGQDCDDFLSFADTYNQDFLQLQKRGSVGAFGGADELKPHENSFNLPELDKLSDARQEVANYVKQAYAQLPPGSKELILGDDFFAAVATHIPSNTGTFQSNTFFSQFAQVGSESLLIVNQIYSGLTLMFSRFAYCFDEPGASIAEKLQVALEQIQPAGSVIAELKGGYEATNLNLHPIVTPYELVCPGELSTRPINEQIPLEDLYIRDDIQAGQLRLYSKRLDKEVIPLYLGFLMPLVLPEIQQILLNFSYLTMCPLDLWRGTRVPDETAEQMYYPRLRYKNIVVQRAMWRFQPGTLPQRETGQSDASFFLQVGRWRTAQGLPAQVFISPDRAGFSAAPPAPDEKKTPAAVMPTYKPLYVDFENYFSVSLLEAATRKATTGLQVTEMLPNRDHLWFEHEGHAYVSEFVFEMNQIKGENNV